MKDSAQRFTPLDLFFYLTGVSHAFREVKYDKRREKAKKIEKIAFSVRRGAYFRRYHLPVAGITAWAKAHRYATPKSSLTVGRTKTIIVNTPNTVPNGENAQLIQAITKQNL